MAKAKREKPDRFTVPVSGIVAHPLTEKQKDEIKKLNQDLAGKKKKK